VGERYHGSLYFDEKSFVLVDGTEKALRSGISYKYIKRMYGSD